MKNDDLSLNVRLLAIMVTAGVVACIGVFFLHMFQVKRHSTVFLGTARAGVEDLSRVEDPLGRADKVKAMRELAKMVLS